MSEKRPIGDSGQVPHWTERQPTWTQLLGGLVFQRAFTWWPDSMSGVDRSRRHFLTTDRQILTLSGLFDIHDPNSFAETVELSAPDRSNKITDLTSDTPSSGCLFGNFYIDFNTEGHPTEVSSSEDDSHHPLPLKETEDLFNIVALSTPIGGTEYEVWRGSGKIWIAQDYIEGSITS